MGDTNIRNFENILSVLLPMSVSAGIGGLALQLIGGNLVMPVLLLFWLAGIIAVHCIMQAGERRRKIAAIAALALAVLYVVITFPLFKAGLAVVLNDAIDSFQQIRPKNYTSFYVGDVSIVLCKTLFMAWVSAAFGAYVTAACRRGKKIHLILTILAWLVIVTVFYSVLSPAWVTASAVSVMLWAFHCHTARRAKRAQDAAPGDTALTARVIVIALAVCFIFNLAWPQEEYRKGRLAEKAEALAADIIDDVRYGGEKDSGMPEGKVYEAGSLKLIDEDVLKITMEEPDSYYLRGFVGETYENSQWKQLSGEALYHSINMFYWLHNDGFFGENQLANAASIGEDVEESLMKVENIGASRKYIYAPYEIASESSLLDTDEAGDSRIKAKGLMGETSYTLSVVPNQVRRYRQLSVELADAAAQGKAEQYIKNESYYNEFVYENYTEVPQAISSLLYEYLGEYVVAGGESHFDYQLAKQNIIYFMTEKMEYSEEASQTGKDVDFILNFLEGTKKGYDVHFASAAVMMFRYYGIPARYVEGYLITKDDVAGLSGEATLTIDGTHAHAWVEYYHDGLGWLPFEVTPTYLNVMESSDRLQDISGLLGQAEGVNKSIEEQEEEEVDTPDGIQSFWIKHKLVILLVTMSLLIAVLIGLFILWLVRERRKTAARIASFDDEEEAKAIESIFSYTVDLLLAWGLKPEKGHLQTQEDEIARLLERDCHDEYAQVIETVQEARYSRHVIEAGAREKVRSFKDEIRSKMFGEAGFIRRLKYKYMYFL